MPAGDVETYHEDGKWKNRATGSSRALSVHQTKSEAEAVGREAASRRGVEHIIKKRDGTIGERNTYPRSRDPRDIPG